MSVALLSAVEQLGMLREKKISPVELAEEYVRRIERLNPGLNAIVHFDAEKVREQARRGSSGILAGLPVTIKSSISVAGELAELGSLLRKGERAEEDAVAVAALRAEGAVFLGMTNCPELLMAYETDNRLYGRTNNPWDVARTAGGIERRGSGGDCGGDVGGRAGERQWRVGAGAGALLRDLRGEADAGEDIEPGASAGECGAVCDAGGDRADGADDGGCGVAVPCGIATMCGRSW